MTTSKRKPKKKQKPCVWVTEWLDPACETWRPSARTAIGTAGRAELRRLIRHRPGFRVRKYVRAGR